MKKYVALLLALIFTTLVITGCGETFSGVGKDTRRIGKGVKTIFVRDE
ncbi:MAG: hypothetical protein ISS92_01340 [Candidatus Omnitrophica bacterium]|nr:hypothetical protein [Candidatus Omnitrophota bacterium]